MSTWCPHCGSWDGEGHNADEARTLAAAADHALLVNSAFAKSPAGVGLQAALNAFRTTPPRHVEEDG